MAFNNILNNMQTRVNKEPHIFDPQQIWQKKEK